MRKAYLDHVATNPLNPEVFEAMLPYFKEEFGNPLSIYDLGTRAKTAIEDARQKVASLINARPNGIIFTSSGAEANNFALRGIALANQEKGKHLIVSKMEHHSILNPARSLERMGFAVTYLPPDKYGIIEPDVLRKAITKETILISVMHANGEVGTIEPIKELSAIARERGILFHTDAVVSAGNIPVDVKQLGVDLLTLSAHQFYGPKGAGALYIREGIRIMPLIYGGIQEGGRRAGTENVPAIVGMGRAAEIAKRDMDKRYAHVKLLRDKLISGIMQTENVYLTGHPEKRLPGHASFCIEFIEGESMLLMLAMQGIDVASGSACTSKALKASPVLLAMGIPASLAQGSIVFTFGEGNTDEDADYVLQVFPQVVKRLREISPYSQGLGDKEAGKCIRN